MLTIRLQRTGKKNQADFRIVLAEKEAPVTRKFVEILGSYNPRKKDFKIKEDRVKYWISQNIEMSATVNNLFVTKGLLTTGKVQAFTIPKKPVEKAPEAAAAVPAAEASAPAPEAAAPAEATADKPAEAAPAEVKAEEKPAEPIAE